MAPGSEKEPCGGREDMFACGMSCVASLMGGGGTLPGLSKPLTVDRICVSLGPTGGPAGGAGGGGAACGITCVESSPGPPYAGPNAVVGALYAPPSWAGTSGPLWIMVGASWPGAGPAW